MNLGTVLLLAILPHSVGLSSSQPKESQNRDSIEVRASSSKQGPIGKPGLVATYRHESGGQIPGSVVRSFTLALGPLEDKNGHQFQWLHLHAAKANGEAFSVWILSKGYPPASVAAARETTARYILQEGNTQALEFAHQFSDEAVLPSLGAWSHLFPHAADSVSSKGVFAEKTRYLGNIYLLERLDNSINVPAPDNIRILELLPDVLIGVPHNTRQKDETRRYDDSDYELIRLRKNDYHEMIEAGMNCLRVDKEQAGWIDQVTPESVRESVRAAGPWGAGLYIVLFSLGELVHIPGIMFVAAGILAYGKLFGFALGLLGAIVSVSFSNSSRLGIGSSAKTRGLSASPSSPFFVGTNRPSGTIA